jgi:hypothetical protein
METWFLKGAYPFIEAGILHALTVKNRNKHVLLVEPDAMSITRALVVKAMKNTGNALPKFQCQLIGSVYFHPSTNLENNTEGIKVKIGIGDTQKMEEIEDVWREIEKLTDSSQPNHPDQGANGGKKKRGKTRS